MENNEDLLAQAKEIQRQKLLAQAKEIQSAALQDQAPQDESTIDQIKQGALKGLDYAGRGLDYLGGVTRTAGSYPFVKQVTGQDVLNAFKAHPLSGNQILEKAGVSQGKSLSDVIPGYSKEPAPWYVPEKGGALDPTARGAAGLALEIGTDPLAMASIGVKAGTNAARMAGRALTPAEKLLQYSTRPVGTALEDIGTSRYKSALRGVDESLKSAGKPAISDTFIQQGMPVGNMQTLKAKAKVFADQAGQAMGNIETEAAGKGATVNMLPAMDDAMELSSEMRASPHPSVQAAGQKLDDITASYLEKGEKVPVDKAREWSSEANKLASEQAFNPMTANNVPFASEANREIGQGLKGEVYKSIENTTPELSDQYKLANQQYSTLASKPAQRELKNAAKVERKKNAITLVDAMIASGSLANPTIGLPILGAKKAIEFGNSALGRTMAGKGLYNLGNYGDQILRRPSVWQDIYNKNNNGEE